MIPSISYRTYYYFFLIISCLSTNHLAQSTPKKNLTLSEKKILKEVLSSSLFMEKIRNQREKDLSQLREQKYSFFSLDTFSNFKQSKRKNPRIAFFESKEVKNANWTLGAEANIPFGFNLKSAYSDLSTEQTYSDFLKSANAPENIYRKNLSLELNASLTEVFAQNWTLQSIKQNQNSTKWLYYEKAEDLALEALRQYWKTYLVWMTYTQSKAGLKIYHKLVRQTNNKKKYNFLRPGERPQILAEYEKLKQNTDKQKQIYESEKHTLFLYLKKEPHLYTVNFKEDSIQKLPLFKKINLESTRTIKIQKKQILAKELRLKSSKARLFPNINFLIKGAYIPGGDNRENLEFSNKHSFYETGVSLKWLLYSKSATEKLKQQKYDIEDSKIDMEILKQKLKNKLDLLEKEILTSYRNINRAKKANTYRKKAFREIRKSFERGQVDIFQLITTENQLRESEVRKKEAQMEYSLLVSQFLALKDELVETHLKL